MASPHTYKAVIEATAQKHLYLDILLSSNTFYLDEISHHQMEAHRRFKGFPSNETILLHRRVPRMRTV